MEFQRLLENELLHHFERIPVTAIIGARQVGKSTLARKILTRYKDVVYLDLELNRNRVALTEPYQFFELNKDKFICLDEIQLLPHTFSEMRGFIDENPRTKFLILGSSSPELLRQSSESLAGRIFYYELTPFLWQEVKGKIGFKDYWFRGGLPKSTLNDNDYAREWLANYTKTFLERDVQQFGYSLPVENLRRLWIMIAHLNGQLLNYSQLSQSIGVSSTTIKNYIDILEHTFMIRRLKPYHANLKKRIVKSPKIYIRDTGILHSLLALDNFQDLYTHPVYGFSWETLVIENVINKYKGYEPYFYRTSNGTELDLILTRGSRKIVVEIKASTAPKISSGFWNALEDIKPDEAYVISQTDQKYPLADRVMVFPLNEFLEKPIEN